MRIFHYSYWHDPRFKNIPGGPIKVFELSSNLTERGHTVYLFTPRLGRPELQTTARVVAVPFIDLPLVRFPSFQFSMLFLSLVLIAREGRPDIFYVRIMWSFLPMVLAKLLSVPVLLEINDSPYRAYAATRSMLKRILIRGIDRITYALSDHIFPVTQKIADDLQRFERISEKKMTVLPSGTNTALFRPLDRRDCRRELGIPEDLLCIGFIGNFFPYQGIDTLIACAPELISADRNIRFLLVGDGPMRSAWTDMIRSSRLDEYFILPGFVPYERVPVYCGAMDICTAPLKSEAGESSAVKVYDYLACAKPVIMSDIGGTGKGFKETGAVCLIPPDDPGALANALIRLLKHSEQRSAMGEKGREAVLSRYSRLNLAGIVVETAKRLIEE